MPQSIEQLVYTSFSTLESKMLASTKMPQAVQQVFEQTIVHPYLNHPTFDGLKMSAAYLHQIEPNALLFGWLYRDEAAQGSEELIARFICYYSTQFLDGDQLELIFKCLEKGPATPLNGWATLNVLGPVVLPESGDYESTRSGVAIPSSIRAKTRLLLYKQKLLHCFVPSEALMDDVAPPEIQTELMGSHSIVEAYSHLASTSAAAATLVGKYALLIGVSNQNLGMRTLPGVEQDVETLQKVLADPLIGNFAEVSTLLNPDSPVMAERLESFLTHCPTDSMAVIYFSGYGILDRQGTLCLSTGSSRRNEQGKIIRSTFVATDFLAAVMRDSSPRYKTLILDICFSAENIHHDAIRQQTLDLARQQLGGSGHTILVSSRIKGDVGPQKGFRPSVYTFYLVEGLATGIADKNGDGFITLEELHTYAKHKTKVTSPALSPSLYGEISEKRQVIAMAPVNNPKLRYRREVERLAQNGSISLVNELMLNDIQKMLNLSSEDAAKIKVEVLKPYKDYQLKLRQFTLKYLNRFYQKNRDETNVNSEVLSLQNSLGLTDQATSKIKAEILYRFNEIQLSDPTLSSLMTEGDVQAWQVSLQSQFSYFIRNSLKLSTFKEYVNRLLLFFSNTNFQHKVFDNAQRFLKKETILPSRDRWFAQVAGLFRLPLSSQANSSLSLRWRLGLISLGVIFALIGFYLLSITLLNNRQAQEQQQAVQDLENFVQQQKYDQCEVFSQSLSQKLSRLALIQSLVEQCKVGFRWQKARVQPISTASSEVGAIAFRPNSQILASGSDDGKIRLWDTGKQRLVQTLSGHLSRVWSVGFSQDGKFLSSGSRDKTVNLWSLSTNKRLYSFKGHRDTVWSTAFTSDGRWLASGSEDGTIKLWNVAKGTLGRTINPKAGAIRAMVAGVDGKTLYSGGADKAITAWDTDTGKPRFKLQTYSDRVIALAVNQDETMLASGSIDKTITIWNLRNQTLLRTITKNDASVQNLAFSSDNQTLASNIGGTIQIWDLKTGQFIWKFSDLSSKVTAMDFDRDGQTLAIARQDKVLNLLQPELSR